MFSIIFLRWKIDFVEKKNPADYEPSNFDIDRINEDPAYALDRLNFITQKFIQELFPFKVRALVKPGIFFQWTGGWYYERGPWRLQLTTDFWARTQERFGSLCIPPKTPRLDITDGIKPAAYQSRIGGSVAYSVTYPTKTWTFSLYGDKTYWSEGIGKDLNIVLNFECNY